MKSCLDLQQEIVIMNKVSVSLNSVDDVKDNYAMSALLPVLIEESDNADILIKLSALR